MDEEKYLENLIDTFATEGWKSFISDVEEASKPIKDLASIRNTEEFWMRKGALEVYTRILAYQPLIEQSYEELNG